jgi:hypothetical protein
VDAAGPRDKTDMQVIYATRTKYLGIRKGIEIPKKTKGVAASCCVWIDQCVNTD